MPPRKKERKKEREGERKRERKFADGRERAWMVWIGPSYEFLSVRRGKVCHVGFWAFHFFWEASGLHLMEPNKSLDRGKSMCALHHTLCLLVLRSLWCHA